jgi:HPt (histidine-containing phosphotransfer) domain-containing protein
MTTSDLSGIPLVVPRRLADLVDAIGDADVVRASVRQYLQLMPERSAALSAGLGQPDPDEGTAVFRVAHTLKSSSYMFGLDAVAAAAAEVEATPGDTDRIRVLLDVMARSADALEAALDARPSPPPRPRAGPAGPGGAAGC